MKRLLKSLFLFVFLELFVYGLFALPQGEWIVSNWMFVNTYGDDLSGLLYFIWFVMSICALIFSMKFYNELDEN